MTSTVRTIVVTGASGFIGSRLVERLSTLTGVNVRALHRANVPRANSRNVEWRRVEFGSERCLKDAVAGATCVFHLASRVHRVSERDGLAAHREITVEGTRRLARAMVSAGCERLVFVSSVAVYGPLSVGKHSEVTERRPTSAYGHAKAEAEDVLIRGFMNELSVFVLRPPMVYGAGCKGNLPRMVKLMQRGLFPPLPELGNRRSFVHVDNLLDCLVSASSAGDVNAGIYNVADERAHSSRELQDIVRAALGRAPMSWSFPAAVLRAAGVSGDVLSGALGRRFPLDSRVVESLLDPAELDISRARAELGFDPKHSLEDGVKAMLAAW